MEICQQIYTPQEIYKFFCSVHPKEKIEFYCEKDEEYICSKCILNHADHIKKTKLIDQEYIKK